jgi:hypothetical protein
MEPPWLQPVAVSGKWTERTIREDKRNPLPSAAHACCVQRMVRRGSTVPTPAEGLHEVPAKWTFVVVCSCNTRIHSGHIGGTRDAAPGEAELSVARLGHGLDVRGELSVQERVHRETARLGGNLDLVRVEAEARLHVRAGDRKDNPPGELRSHRAVEMAGNNSPHVRMALQNVTQRASIGGWQADLIPGRDSGRNGRMVERNQRHSIPRACQLSVEPTQPVSIQFAPLLPGSRAVQDDEPQRPEIHRILHRSSLCSGDVEMPPERVTVVMVSRQDIDGRPEVREQFTHDLVLAVGSMFRQVA